MESAALTPGRMLADDLSSETLSAGVVSANSAALIRGSSPQGSVQISGASGTGAASCVGICPTLTASAIRAGALSRALDDADRVIAELHARIDTLEQLAMMDELTGVLNRRGFTAQLRHILACNNRAIAAGEPATGILMLFDLNDFKSVNDAHGHPVGDLVLCAIARQLLSQVRIGDAVARLGGDEFAVLLSGILPEAGIMRASQLARTLDGLKVITPSGVTLHIGVACGWSVLGIEDDETSLLTRADEALYRNKANKRTDPRLSDCSGAQCAVTLQRSNMR